MARFIDTLQKPAGILKRNAFAFSLPKPTVADPDWVRHLHDHGYAVVPRVLASAVLLEDLREQLRLDLIAFTNGALDIADERTYQAWANVLVLHSMLIQHHGVGHLSTLWRIRQLQAVVDVFATLWKVAPGDLLTSVDALSVHLPPEKLTTPTGRPKGFFRGSSSLWLHTDQGPLTPGDCVQGGVSLYDVTEADATLVVLDGSHKHHAEFMRAFPPEKPKEDWHKVDTDAKRAFFEERGCKLVAVSMPAGSVVLWNSKTIHCGREPLNTRARPTTRLFAYVCYTPRPVAGPNPLVKDGVVTDGDVNAFLRRKLWAIFVDGATMSHWPHHVDKFSFEPQTYGRTDLIPLTRPPVPAFEDFTPLGKRLVGGDAPVVVAATAAAATAASAAARPVLASAYGAGGLAYLRALSMAAHAEAGAVVSAGTASGAASGTSADAESSYCPAAKRQMTAHQSDD